MKTETSKTYPTALDFVTGFDTVAWGTGTKVRLRILPGYTGLQQCNASEVMMHMHLTDKTMLFHFYTYAGDGYTGEAVQLLNPDGTKYSGSVTRGEGGVFLNEYNPETKTSTYYYYLGVDDLVNEYATEMARLAHDVPAMIAKFGYSVDAHMYDQKQAVLVRLAAKWHLHPTVLHDICEDILHADDHFSDDSDEAREARTQIRGWAGETTGDMTADMGDGYNHDYRSDEDRPMKDMAD